MSDELWEKVKATVTPLSEGKTPAIPLLDETTFPRKIDLHGIDVAGAYAEVSQYVTDAVSLGIKKVWVITGKSGVIRQEFPTWAELNSKIKSFAPVNDGAFMLELI